MVSRCCRAALYAASAVYSHLHDDWYECSQCLMPCDTIHYKEPKEGKQDE